MANLQSVFGFERWAQQPNKSLQKSKKLGLKKNYFFFCESPESVQNFNGCFVKCNSGWFKPP
jgi:hypothetical protein